MEVLGELSFLIENVTYYLGEILLISRFGSTKIPAWYDVGLFFHILGHE